MLLFYCAQLLVTNGILGILALQARRHKVSDLSNSPISINTEASVECKVPGPKTQAMRAIEIISGDASSWITEYTRFTNMSEPVKRCYWKVYPELMDAIKKASQEASGSLKIVELFVPQSEPDKLMFRVASGSGGIDAVAVVCPFAPHFADDIIVKLIKEREPLTAEIHFSPLTPARTATRQPQVWLCLPEVPKGINIIYSSLLLENIFSSETSVAVKKDGWTVYANMLTDKKFLVDEFPIQVSTASSKVKVKKAVVQHRMKLPSSGAVATLNNTLMWAELNPVVVYFFPKSPGRISKFFRSWFGKGRKKKLWEAFTQMKSFIDDMDSRIEEQMRTVSFGVTLMDLVKKAKISLSYITLTGIRDCTVCIYMTFQDSSLSPICTPSRCEKTLPNLLKGDSGAPSVNLAAYNYHLKFYKFDKTIRLNRGSIVLPQGYRVPAKCVVVWNRVTSANNAGDATASDHDASLLTGPDFRTQNIPDANRLHAIVSRPSLVQANKVPPKPPRTFAEQGRSGDTGPLHGAENADRLYATVSRPSSVQANKAPPKPFPKPPRTFAEQGRSGDTGPLHGAENADRLYATVSRPFSVVASKAPLGMPNKVKLKVIRLSGDTEPLRRVEDGNQLERTGTGLFSVPKDDRPPLPPRRNQ